MTTNGAAVTVWIKKARALRGVLIMLDLKFSRKRKWMFSEL